MRSMPALRELAQRAVRALERWTVREQDGADAQAGERVERPARAAEILAPVRVRRVERPVVIAPERVPDEHDPLSLRVQAHAAGGMAGRVDDSKAAQYGDNIAVGHVDRRR